jgi:hypothetical protein
MRTVLHLTRDFLKNRGKNKSTNLRRYVNKKRRQNEDTIRMRSYTGNIIQQCHKVKTGFKSQQRMTIVRAKI